MPAGFRGIRHRWCVTTGNPVITRGTQLPTPRRCLHDLYDYAFPLLLPPAPPILLPVLFLSFFLSQSHLFAEKVTRFRVVSFLFSRVKAGEHIGMVSIEYFPGEAVSRAIDPPSIGGGRVIHHFEAERQEAR